MSILSRLPPDKKRKALRLAARRLKRKVAKSSGFDILSRFSTYHDDPVRFAVEQMGIKPWSRQRDLLQAVADHPRVLCRSGHKCGKTLATIILAPWWIATRHNSRVVLLATSMDQIKAVPWDELSKWYPQLKGILGGTEWKLDPATGVSFIGGRRIIGRSTNKPESLAGLSGANQLFILDEGSGFPDEMFQPVMGNAAADGCRIVAISNPTRTVGWFFDGFKSGTYNLGPDSGHPPHSWRLLHISSDESPNITGEGDPVPGLAGPGWLAEMRDRCGPDYENSAEYNVRVLGQFPAQGTDVVIGYRTVREAVARWLDAVAPSFGETVIGVDVARYGDDEIVIQAVRGLYAWPAVVLSKMDGPEVAEAAVELAVKVRRPGERVRVNVDGIGVGASVVDALGVHEACRDRKIVGVVDVNVGQKADDEEHYVNLRSQVWFGLADWLKDGGAIPDDDRLESELLAPTYSFDARNRKKVEPKDSIKKTLKRSPDRADALCLAVYRGRDTAYAYEPVKDTKRGDRRDGWESAGGGRRGAL